MRSPDFPYAIGYERAPQGFAEAVTEAGTYMESSGSGRAKDVAVAIPKTLFADILRMIAELRPEPDPSPA